MERVWLRARSACPPPFPVPVCGVGVCARVWVSAAPRLSYGGCWGVCVLVRPSRVVSCTSWLGLLCGGACLCARPACSPPFLAGVRCVGVHAGPGSRLCPALLGWVFRVRFLRFSFGRVLVSLCCVGCWLSLSRALWSLPPHPPSFGLGCWLFFFSSVVCVCMFRCPFSWWAAVPGLVLPVLAWWSPCASFGVLSSVPSGLGVWPLLVVLAGGSVVVGCSLAPPPPVFLLLWGGLSVLHSAFPGLAHALARIQCGLPGCCWRLRSAWPCPGPRGRAGYVHVWLGAPSCRVRSWLCRLGVCARRLRLALG